MALTYNQSERIVEIAFYEIYSHMRQSIPSDKLFLFIEAFSRAFGVDYTSVSIAITQFHRKLKPTKQEKVLFGMITGVTLKTLGMDYRTIRSYKKRFENNQIEFFPRLMNRFLRDDLRKFIKGYLALFPSESQYLHQFNVEGGFNEVSRSSGTT
jgi:hypothetical protein